MNVLIANYKNMRDYYRLFIIIVIFCCSCNNTKSPSEYKKWVDDFKNGLSQQISTGHYELFLKYKPVDYMVINELRSDKISFEQYNAVKEQFGNLVYFDFAIQRDDGTPLFDSDSTHLAEFYCMDIIQKDFYLLTGSDSTPCAFFHLIADGNSVKKTMLLAFDKSPEILKNDFSLLYYDRVFGIGPVTFPFYSEYINNIPKLKIL